MPPTQRTFKHCQNHHIVGEVIKVQAGGREINALAVYESSVLAEPPRLPILRGKLVATSLDFRCTYPGCNATYDWFIGQDFLNALLKRHS